MAIRSAIVVLLLFKAISGIRISEVAPTTQGQPGENDVAIVIHAFDEEKSMKFWPTVLKGVTEHLLGGDAPAGWKVYFSNEEKDISCLTKDLSVPVTQIKTGSRGPHGGPVKGFGWSLRETLKQIPEKWMIYIQEDVMFGAPETQERLLAIQRFANEKDAKFIFLERQGGGWAAGEKFPQVDENGQDLGFSFVRNNGGVYTFNHGVAFSNRAWFLDHITQYHIEDDDGPWTAENQAQAIRPGESFFEKGKSSSGITEKELQHFFFTEYDGGLDAQTCEYNAGCEKHIAEINEFGCRADPFYNTPGGPLGLDKVMRIGHVMYGSVNECYGKFHQMSASMLSLPPPASLENFNNAEMLACVQ